MPGRPDPDSADPKSIAQRVLLLYPHTYAEEAGIRSPGSESALFQLLVMALLMSARIRASVALDATRALFEHGWTTAKSMARADWAERTRVLNRSGYARYDERTSSMLEETAQHLVDHFEGDLRRLRDEAGRDPATERRLLKRCKGIGDVGVDIFFRQAQGSWPELFPFADSRALRAAKRLGLGEEAEPLVRLVVAKDFPRLVDALVRVDLDRSYAQLVP